MLAKIEPIGRPFLKYFLTPACFEAWTFYMRLGYWPNLKEPRTFNEVICYRKLYEESFPFSDLVDKLAVRKFVENRIGNSYFTHIIRKYGTPEEIRLSDLPEAFAFKSNAGSGMNRIVRNKHEVSETMLANLARTWMAKPYSQKSRTLERIYDETPRRVYAEELLEPLDSVREYKFWCMGGEPLFVQSLVRDQIASAYEVFLPNGQPAEFCVFNPGPQKPSEPPTCLSQLCELATKLAAGFDFVRVDLNVSGADRITFSELTFHPGGGRVRFFPRIKDIELGQRMPRFAQGPGRIFQACP